MHIENEIPIRVLLADDSETLRRGMKALLRSEPSIHLVGEACNYLELLTMLGELSTDVIVMDVYMPGADDLNPESVRAQLTTSCLLAISFANDEETKNQAKRFGAVRLLDKIELGRTLIPAIKSCQQEKS